MQSEGGQGRGPARILVVDDQAAHAELLAEALIPVGYQCQVATSADEARDLLRREGADIVITDLVLGDRDGLDLIREAQSIDPFIAVVVVTGHGTVETAVEAMQLGAVDYLRKPVDLTGLRIRVERALEGAALKRHADQLERTIDEEGQIRLFKEIIELNRKNLWVIGTVGAIPQIFIVNERFRNVPEVAVGCWPLRTPGATAPESYAIEPN